MRPGAATFAAITLAAALSGGDAIAQCVAAASSCTTCHETHNAAPVHGDGNPWHRDHAFGDFCAGCHGGDAASQSEAAAHARLVAPLEDVSARCEPCHANTASTLVERYRGFRNAAPRRTSGRACIPGSPAGSSRRRNTWLAVFIVALGAGGGGYVVRSERRRRDLHDGGKDR